ncbi:MAG: hypothetical protein LBS23_01580 [Holosporaceae bacterium]|jgi:BirA family biotin operon repressor/biotin-[acetyl-CoA-carboxylase] ligase|nr:hypothetical protein [Holosporaceae bacterium]
MADFSHNFSSCLRPKDTKKPIIKLKTIDSTHKFAVRLIESGDVSECVIIAENQTASIGRCGREWISIPGNFFASIIQKMPANVNFGQLSLSMACAVRESIAHYIINGELTKHDDSRNNKLLEIAENLRLHWPNDIYYRNL